MMRNSVCLVFLWLSATPGRAASSGDWEVLWSGNGYGNCALQDCLVPISEVSFCIDTASDSCTCYTDPNACLCTDQTFLNQIGACIACSCANEAADDYVQYKGNCLADGDYTIPVSESVFTSCGTNGSYFYYEPSLI